MNILGLSWLTHDASATLICDGRMVSMAEEERFTRRKHDPSFPSNAIRLGLRLAGLKANEIHVVALPYRAFLGVGSRLKYALDNLVRDPAYFPRTLRSEMRHWIGLEDETRAQFRRAGLELSSTCRIVALEHHLCHAASAYFSSPYDSASILTWDGRGEWPCLMRAVGEGGSIRVVDREFAPNSLGQFYESFTRYLGFGDYGDEYKVMGLASYGKPDFISAFRDVIRLVSGQVHIDPRRWRYHAHQRMTGDGYRIGMDDVLGPARKSDEAIGVRHMAIAASLQTRLNELTVEIARNFRSTQPNAKLCLAGGVSQNIVANQHIFRESGFADIFVQPAAHDAGLGLGAALMLATEAGDMRERFRMRSTAWGAAFSPGDVAAELKTYGLPYVVVDDPADTAARLLAQGLVIGWFQGRAEFGPRALGQRSILADPRRPEMKELVNRKIKFREEFRPFAPAVLRERHGDFFDGAPANPFMTFAANAVGTQSSSIPAVVHVDGTARPQSVDREDNPLFWSLIDAFAKRTDVPVLLNTSFNVKGEPIVNSPTDAIRCFYSTGLDALILEDCLLLKGDVSPDATGF